MQVCEGSLLASFMGKPKPQSIFWLKVFDLGFGGSFGFTDKLESGLVPWERTFFVHAHRWSLESKLLSFDS